ncbi:MAG: CsbD-like [Thermoleophilia bacterium]|nr:CsbD-like [Thermoleophilia bacterium]
MAGKMDKLKGEAKEGFGKATGDRSTENKGKLDKAKGGVKDTAQDVRDSVRDTVRDAKHDSDRDRS